MITRKLVVVPPIGGASAHQSHQFRFLIKISTVGNNIADKIPCQASGVGVRIIGMLRVVIASDLTVRVNHDGSELFTFTIPSATAVGVPVISSTFANDPQPFVDTKYFEFDITASSGEIAAAGVASITCQWIGA